MGNLKKVSLALLAILVIIQFIHPAKNDSGENTNALSKAYPVPEKVAEILKNACNDCHSNTTTYPWYSKIQPVDWWMTHHVNDGRKHLNFDEFLSYRPARQFHKLEEIDEVVEEGEMPMASYTWMHPKAKLSDQEKEILVSWSKELRDSMSARYPADSLKMPPKK